MSRVGVCHQQTTKDHCTGPEMENQWPTPPGLSSGLMVSRKDSLLNPLGLWRAYQSNNQEGWGPLDHAKDDHTLDIPQSSGIVVGKVG